MCLYIIGKHWGSFLSHCICENVHSDKWVAGAVSLLYNFQSCELLSLLVQFHQLAL